MEDEAPIEVHKPCESCGSSDALAVYESHTFCFSCSDHKFTKERSGRVTAPTEFNVIPGETMALKARGLSLESCRKFGYTVGTYKGKPVQIATYRRDGKIVGQKLRTKNKEFSWNGGKRPGLFGQQCWKSGGRKITICEGEIDCMSLSQMQDHKWATVSLPHGAAAAKKAIKEELEWLETFDEIVFMLDNDEAGIKAAHECVQLISPGKGKIAQLPLKDVNEMLLAGRSQECIAAMWGAKDYLPSGIVNADTLWDKIQQPIEKGLSYPWESLTDLTHGIRLGEIITLGAGTGLGKTTIFKQIAYHMMTVHKKKVGMIFLEEANTMTALSLMSMAVSKPLHLPGTVINEKEKKDAYDGLFKEGNCFLFDHFGSTDFEEIKIRMRFLAVSCGCKYLFLDHLTALTSGGKQNDERKEIDKIMTELASLVRELNISLFMISHLNTPESGCHEEGAHVSIRQFRGSRSIGQWSSYLWALERNQQADDVNERHTSTFRILKDRFSGEATGATFGLKFDSTTQLLSEVDISRAVEVKNPFKTIQIQESENDFTDF